MRRYLPGPDAPWVGLRAGRESFARARYCLRTTVFRPCFMFRLSFRTLTAEGRATEPKGPAAEAAGPSPTQGQLVWIEVSSITKLVCSEESSTPLNFRVTVWPA
ncbi:hypothetical protein GCM10010193_64520 [Kitasatospora atroaurantiaca]